MFVFLSWFLVFFISCLPTRQAIIAYDCSGLNINVTTISLIHNKQCDHDIHHELIIPTQIQLVQKTEINYRNIPMFNNNTTNHPLLWNAFTFVCYSERICDTS